MHFKWWSDRKEPLSVLQVVSMFPLTLKESSQAYFLLLFKYSILLLAQEKNPLDYVVLVFTGFMVKFCSAHSCSYDVRDKSSS